MEHISVSLKRNIEDLKKYMATSKSIEANKGSMMSKICEKCEIKYKCNEQFKYDVFTSCGGFEPTNKGGVMRKYDLVEVKQRKLVEWTCSVCGKDLMVDDLESQETFSFSQVGGYSSVFGDGREIYIDICQHCFKEKLGDYCTII